MNVLKDGTEFESSSASPHGILTQPSEKIGGISIKQNVNKPMSGRVTDGKSVNK